MRVALALIWMPAPARRNASACSNSRQSMPRCRSASAVVMPPLAIRILRFPRDANSPLLAKLQETEARHG